MDSPARVVSSTEEEKVLISQIEKELDDPKLFKGIPFDKKQQILTRFAVKILRIKQHSGPLPDSETLSEYNSIVPGSADRIITVFEKQADHRMGLEKKVIGRQTFQSGVGQIFAFLIGMGALGGGVWCILQGHDAAGTAVVSGGLLSLGAAFLKAKTMQQEDLDRKKSK